MGPIKFYNNENNNNDKKKSAEEDWLQSPETILTTRGPAERPEIKSGKKNNSMDVLND